MTKSSKLRNLFFALLTFFYFFSTQMASAHVNFIHSTNESEFFTMYVDDKNVYLQRCKPQIHPDFDKNCEKQYKAKALSFKEYFNAIPLETGSFSKEPNSILVIESAVESARKLAEEGNERAKEKLKHLNLYKDNLLLIDAHRKALKNEIEDKIEIIWDFSDHYRDFLQPFDRIREQVANDEADQIPDYTAAQFAEIFNKASAITLDEIPDQQFIFGKQFKFLDFKAVVDQGGFGRFAWVPVQEILKSSSHFSNRSSGENNPYAQMRYLHSVEDPYRINEVQHRAIRVTISEDSNELSFSHDVIAGLKPDKCPKRYKVRKIKFPQNPITYLMIWAEMTTTNQGNIENCKPLPSNMLNLANGFMGILSKS